MQAPQPASADRIGSRSGSAFAALNEPLLSPVVGRSSVTDRALLDQRRVVAELQKRHPACGALHEKWLDAEATTAQTAP